MSDLCYLTLIKKTRGFSLLNFLRMRFSQSFPQLYHIRWFDENGKYLQEAMREKNKLPERLQSLKDIGWCVARMHDDSGVHYSEPVPPEQRMDTKAYKF